MAGAVDSHNASTRQRARFVLHIGFRLGKSKSQFHLQVSLRGTLLALPLLMNPAEMSDIEDEMDVDVPTTSKSSIQFSAAGDAGKQKRVVADLPVNIGDSLPWYGLVHVVTPTMTNVPQG